jgi:hypothetical protein
MTDDPFANLGATGAKDEPQDAPAAVAVAEPSSDSTDLDDYFATEMTIGEEEFKQPQERIQYKMPEDKTWVPVVILDAKIGQRDMNVMVAKDGEKTAELRSIDRFELECQHATDVYGERSWPYLLSAPVFDLEMPTKSGRTWTKSSGRKLLAATRVTKPGQRITKDTLDELAEAMKGKVVMAQIRIVEKKNKERVPLKDSSGTILRARVDDEDEYVRIVKNDAGELVMEATGQICPVGAESLLKVEDYYLIPDETGRIVHTMEETIRYFDNLQDDVAPVPNRDVAYTRLDGKQGKAEVTMETVGAMTTRPLKVGTEVSAVVGKAGEVIRLSWIGSAWNEVELAGGTDVFKG